MSSKKSVERSIPYSVLSSVGLSWNVKYMNHNTFMKLAHLICNTLNTLLRM